MFQGGEIGLQVSVPPIQHIPPLDHTTPIILKSTIHFNISYFQSVLMLSVLKWCIKKHYVILYNGEYENK